VFEERDHVESKHAETGLCFRPVAARRCEAPARAWSTAGTARRNLRDSLLSAGALCETLETATIGSNVPALKAAVTER